MNYYQSRELLDPDTGKRTGLWLYTCRNDGRTWSVGYCSPWQSCPDCHGRSCRNVPVNTRLESYDCPLCEDTGCVRVAKPCPGHPTKEAAEEHYRQYLLDTAIYEGAWAEVQHKCVVCQKWTSRYASYGPGKISCVDLCDEHCNRAGLEPFVAVGVAISSG